MEKVLSYFQAHKQRFLDDLKAILRIPSISAQSDHKQDIRTCATLVQRYLNAAGFDAKIMETDGHPVVVADSGPVEGPEPTLLVYGHYDVQPEGDQKLWDSPPFEPTVRDGCIFARGAADDKGQILTHVHAAECWARGAGKFPLRTKFLIEGEEEISSAHLEPFIRKHTDLLACDYIVLSDTPQLGVNQPAITYGTKGLVYKELFLDGPKQNLHSGAFGGTVANPANVMAHVIAALYGADGRVSIPGFYDHVVEISPDEKETLRALPIDDASYLARLGSPSLFGEAGYSTLERRWVRPTLDVNGIVGGYIGEGASTVVPARASAKVSMRLVPDQDPAKISRSFDEWVRANCPDTVRLRIVDHGAAAAYVAPLDSAGMRAASAAVKSGFGVEPALIREGGTLPILPMFKEVLGADSIMMGFSQPDCNLHGPNEFMRIDDFEAGIRSAAYFLAELASA